MILIRRLVWPTIRTALPMMRCQIPSYSFTMMSLFEQPKKAAELDPYFRKPTRQKGHHKSKRTSGRISQKLSPKRKFGFTKLKSHHGMLKRVKLVGPRWNRMFKRLHAENYHKKRNKSRNNLQRKKRPAYVAKVDSWKVKRLLPYYKRRSLKNQY